MTAKNGKDSDDERKARLAAALRANLHRRKAQVRGQGGEERDDPEPQQVKDRSR